MVFRQRIIDIHRKIEASPPHKLTHLPSNRVNRLRHNSISLRSSINFSINQSINQFINRSIIRLISRYRQLDNNSISRSLFLSISLSFSLSLSLSFSLSHFTFLLNQKEKTAGKQNTRKQSSVTMWNTKQLY